MAKAIMETSLDTNLLTEQIVQASVDIRGVFIGEQYRVTRICTKTDNDLKTVMDAHLEEQASHYSKA